MIRHQLPDGMLVQETDSRCSLLVNELRCVFDNWPAKYREKIQHNFIIDEAFTTSKKNFKKTVIQVSADAEVLHMDKEELMEEFMIAYQDSLLEIGLDNREIARMALAAVI